MMKAVVLLLVIALLNVGGAKELKNERARMAQRGLTLTSGEELQLQTRGWRNRRDGEFNPPVSNTSRPSDYVHDGKRGTLEYHPKFRNYSLHISQVPNGTIF